VLLLVVAAVVLRGRRLRQLVGVLLPVGRGRRGQARDRGRGHLLLVVMVVRRPRLLLLLPLLLPLLQERGLGLHAPSGGQQHHLLHPRHVLRTEARATAAAAATARPLLQGLL
jgi:hypothetical protein